MPSQEHPCEIALTRKNSVCKALEVGNFIEVLCTTPNGCGMVNEDAQTILVSKKVYSQIDGKPTLISTEAVRIPVSTWESYRYLICCSWGKERFEGWTTNFPKLNTQEI